MIAGQAERQHHHEILVEQVDATGRIIAAPPSIPSLIADGRRIRECSANPIHAFGADLREDVLCAVTVGTFVKGVAKLILPKIDANAVMGVDRLAAVLADEMLPIGSRVGEMKQGRQRHHQPLAGVCGRH